MEVGTYDLPENVTVHSLGKEQGRGKFSYLFNFYKLIWSLRHEYDNVFVHMNQIYVILGAPFWRIWGKKIGLWYAHGSVPFSLKLAEKLADKIFTASAESFRIKSSKVQVTGHGIDINQFSPQTVQKTIDLITVGRITLSKNLEALVDVLGEVRKTHDISLSIVGSSVTEDEKSYEKNLKTYIKESKLDDRILLEGKIHHVHLPEKLNSAKIFVSTARNGSLDKAVLEAMACGLPVVSMAAGNKSLPLEDNNVSNTADMVDKINKVLESGMYFKPEYKEYISKKHSISSLIPRLLKELS